MENVIKNVENHSKIIFLSFYSFVATHENQKKTKKPNQMFAQKPGTL